MSKPITVSTLVRQCTRSDAEFVETLRLVCGTDTAARIVEFFERLNVPRSVLGDDLQSPLASAGEAASQVGTFEEERLIGDAMQKYMERHLKKVKWHALHPSTEGTQNALLITRQMMLVTDVRIARLRHLLNSKDELTPQDWATARELMNRGFLGFRHLILQFGVQWIDAALAQLDRQELEDTVGSFYELIDQTVRRLEEHHTAIEERRRELTVVPPNYPPVKPPQYFGGDLLGSGPWKQYEDAVQNAAHHFREALG